MKWINPSTNRNHANKMQVQVGNKYKTLQAGLLQGFQVFMRQASILKTPFNNLFQNKNWKRMLYLQLDHFSKVIPINSNNFIHE